MVAHKFKFNESLPEITVKEIGQKILFRGLMMSWKSHISRQIEDTAGHGSEAYQVESEDKFSTVAESIRGSLDASDFFKQITVSLTLWNEKDTGLNAFLIKRRREGYAIASRPLIDATNGWTKSISLIWGFVSNEPQTARNRLRWRVGAWLRGWYLKNYSVRDFDVGDYD